MLKLHFAVLLVAIVVGAALRVDGVRWGLPDDVHASYSYHPDEASLLEWASDLYHGKIISKQFIYGGTFYLTTLEAGKRVAALLRHGAPLSLRERMLAARCSSALFAVLAILFTYLAGATLFTPAAGAWAALALALAPGHVLAAQVARPDALFTLLLVLNVCCAARLLGALGNRQMNLLTAGMLLGVSVATRFPAALWWLGYALALFMAGRDSAPGRRAWLSSLAVVSVVALLAYGLASPHSLRHAAVLFDGLATQFHYQRGAALADAVHHGGALHYGGSVMAEAIGYGSYAPALLALLVAAWRRARADLLLATFALPYFLSLASSQWVLVRYFVPLLPLLALWLGAMIEQGLRSASVVRALSVALALCAFGVNGLTLAVYNRALHLPDSRDRALAWLVTHAAPATRIGVLQGYDGDVYLHPPAIARFEWSACALNVCDPAQFFATAQDFFVVADAQMLETNAAGQRLRVASALAARHDLEAIARFEPLTTWHGYDVRPQFRHHDMREALTTLTIYRRRHGAADDAASQPFR